MNGKREYGDYQTPPAFAKRVCEFLKNILEINPSIIIEPTCGIGNFVKASLIFNAATIYGLEINNTYCLACANEINDSRVKIINCDFFSFDIHSLKSNQNILLIGNPPWVTNSTLSTIGSENLPEKLNFKYFKGIDALTGASNFDICESIILKLISVFNRTNTTIAMLCKTSVARNIFNELNRLNICCNSCGVYEFNAAKIFGINANACLLVIQLTNTVNMTPKTCYIYDFDSPRIIKNTFGYENGRFYSDLSGRYDDFDGKCNFEWRQGIKHDCSMIMELSLKNTLLYNGRNEHIDIEDNLVFPLIKSSMFKKPIINNFTKFVIVTQRKSGDETNHLRNELPRTWTYLMKNKELFDKRKSSIYQSSPQFSMFGVGSYSYTKYKVGISGFYKEPLFCVLYSNDEKPVMVDDTGYFIGFNSFDNAYVAMLYLNTSRVIKFLKGITFRDAKRPFTKKVLSRINFSKIIKVISLHELIETEATLNLKGRLTAKMVENFCNHPGLQNRSLFANTNCYKQ